MNYTQANSNNNQLLTITTDLTFEDFNRLNTDQLTIITGIPNFFIIPVFFFIKYEFGNLQPSGIFIIDDKWQVLGFNNGARLFNFNASDFSNSSGYIQTPSSNYSQQNLIVQSRNTSNGGGLVLSASTNGLNTIPLLKIQVGYYLQSDI